MIFYYLDASAWVKRYCQEMGTSWVQDLFAQNPVIACASLGFIEVMATLARKRKAQEIDPSSFEQKVQELEEDWEHFIQIQLTAEAMDVAKDLAKNLALHGADAVHLASALAGLMRMGQTLGSDRQASGAVVQRSGTAVAWTPLVDPPW